MSTKPQKPLLQEWDRATLEALTDEEIAAQIAANPDAAPDDLDWSDDKVIYMEPVDVKAVRVKTGMTQDEFATAFGLNVAALRDWEQQRRMPRGPARTLLRIIDQEPAAVRRAMKMERVTKPARPAAGEAPNASPAIRKRTTVKG